MRGGIAITQVWADNDAVEFEITSSDGTSAFCNKVYVGHKEFEELIADLGNYRNHIHGGLYNIKFGKFGPEYAGGAFAARLQFHRPGSLAITVQAESEWRKFNNMTVASRATLYLTSEPVLLDNFIQALTRLRSGETHEAALWSV